MVKNFIFFLTLIVMLITSPIFAYPVVEDMIIETTSDKTGVKSYQQPVQRNNSTPVLTGIVSEVQELPSGMYGAWKVKGLLLQTNAPDTYIMNTNDTWILRKNGSFVTLMNPNNGASATITVNEVHNNTATFTRQYTGLGRSEVERVTITLNGDRFYGTDYIYMERTSWGSIKTYSAKYKISGQRTQNLNMGNIIQKPRTFNLSTPY